MRSFEILTFKELPIENQILNRIFKNIRRRRFLQYLLRVYVLFIVKHNNTLKI